MRSQLRVSVLVALLVAPACGKDVANPFATAARVGTRRATSAIAFTSNLWAAQAGAGREVYLADLDGTNLIRITFCNTDSSACDNLDLAAAPDGVRLAVRRLDTDTNKDGRLTLADGQSAFVVDVGRGSEGKLSPLRINTTATTAGNFTTDKLSGIDWSPTDEILVYGAAAENGVDDLFRTVPRPDPTIAETFNLTSTVDVAERRPRIDPTGAVAAYERIDASGKAQVFVYRSLSSQTQVTSGGPGTDPLPGTPYVVGADADPAFSPDGRALVFRRLIATGNGGRGAWDLMRVASDGTAPAILATGPVYRGAPDWGSKGILVTEVGASGLVELVVYQPDGSGRRVILSAPAGYDIAGPRWLPAR